MAVYEMTVRFEAEDDNLALHFAMDADATLKGEAVLTPTDFYVQRCAVERVTRVVVTHVSVGGACDERQGRPCR
jgi:hypothetical protein